MLLIVQRRRIQNNKERLSGGSCSHSTVSDNDGVQEVGFISLLFYVYTIAETTNNFSHKLREGGFAQYKVISAGQVTKWPKCCNKENVSKIWSGVERVSE
jgi:hypothetical protein